jgi:hypothetical protein
MVTVPRITLVDYQGEEKRQTLKRWNIDPVHILLFYKLKSLILPQSVELKSLQFQS